MARRSSLVYLFSVGVFVFALAVAPVRVAHAGSISFGGETEDNFWNISITYCRDGFTVRAIETTPASAPGEVGKTFSVRVAGSSIPVTTGLPVTIAGGVVPAVVSGTITLLYTTSQTVGTPVSATIERLDHGNSNATDDTGDGSGFDDTIVDTDIIRACSVQTANSVQQPVFFDPGDTRIDGWAGDRLAVYCPSDKQIQVIGVGADGKGAGVAVFTPAAVIAAGKAGLSVPLRSYKDPTVNLGMVSIQMMLNDGVTSFYIAWNGGILNATGQGDFKKQFVTPIRFCPFTFR